MVEEKTEKNVHEHKEVNEAKTVTMKKSTLWGVGAFVLLVLLVLSIFTNGFGIMKPTGNAANTGTTGGAVDTKVITSNSDLYPSLGPDNAKATVIEVADFQCPWCALASGLPSWSNDPTNPYASRAPDLIGAAGKLEELASQGKIRLIFVPISFLGQESIYASQAAYCAEDQGKFWEMHDAIYKTHDGSEETGKYSKANLEKLAQNIAGIDQTKFKTCLESDATLNKVQQAMQGASDVASGGVPGFFVNGQKVSSSWTAIQAAINAA